MIREYKTIQEISGPLMVVNHVQGVTYDELAESELTDGTVRMMPRTIPGVEGINTKYCIYSVADSTPTLAEYDFNSDNSKWNFRK